MKHGHGRTVFMILSLVMSVTVYVVLQSFTGLLDDEAVEKLGTKNQSLHAGRESAI